MADVASPAAKPRPPLYGDGHAAERIADILCRRDS